MNFIKTEESDIKTIFSRLKNRDFSGNTGLAIKNSAYQFSTNLIGKIGSLVFIIILARIILPETFGLYNLALSTIMFFYIFSDLGVGQALVFFSSKNLHTNKAKAKAYIDYFFKIKISLVFISLLALIITAKFIADSYYNQPIFLALIAGSLYMMFTSIQSFYIAISQANNNFRNPMLKEIFFQASKIILISGTLLYLKKFSLPDSTTILMIFILLSIVSFLSMSLMHFLSIKSLNLGNVKKIRLNKKDKIEIRKFIFNIILITSSVLLLGNIDKIIIGPFVPPEFIGYYSAAFSLVTSSSFLLILSDVLFPVFLRIKGKRLKRAFGKSVVAIFSMSTILFIFLFIFAAPLIKIIFGPNYEQSVNMLRILALLAIIYPLIELYTSYIISKGNLGKIKKIVLFVLILSIALPLLLVKIMSSYGSSMIVFGLIFGVLISKITHLFCLIWVSRRN